MHLFKKELFSPTKPTRNSCYNLHPILAVSPIRNQQVLKHGTVILTCNFTQSLTLSWGADWALKAEGIPLGNFIPASPVGSSKQELADLWGKLQGLSIYSGCWLEGGTQNFICHFRSHSELTLKLFINCPGLTPSLLKRHCHPESVNESRLWDLLVHPDEIQTKECPIQQCR